MSHQLIRITIIVPLQLITKDATQQCSMKLKIFHTNHKVLDTTHAAQYNTKPLTQLGAAHWSILMSLDVLVIDFFVNVVFGGESLFLSLSFLCSSLLLTSFPF